MAYSKGDHCPNTLGIAHKTPGAPVGVSNISEAVTEATPFREERRAKVVAGLGDWEADRGSGQGLHVGVSTRLRCASLPTQFLCLHIQGHFLEVAGSCPTLRASGLSLLLPFRSHSSSLSLSLIGKRVYSYRRLQLHLLRRVGLSQPHLVRGLLSVLILEHNIFFALRFMLLQTLLLTASHTASRPSASLSTALLLRTVARSPCTCIIQPAQTSTPH